MPNRASLKHTTNLVAEFLEERTGGLRLQVVAISLFKRIGEQFHLFNTVRTNDINAADASTGSVADLECLDGSGGIVMAVEVKDRQLTLHDIQDKLPAMREKGIRELPFLVRGGIEREGQAAASELIDRQFVTGQNIYVVEFQSLLESCLVLFGEAGRRKFLRGIGEELDARRADLSHRKKWAELLAGV